VTTSASPSSPSSLETLSESAPVSEASVSPPLGGSGKKVVVRKKKKVGRKKKTTKKMGEELRVAVVDAVAGTEASESVFAESTPVAVVAAPPAAATVEPKAVAEVKAAEPQPVKNASFTMRFGKGVSVLLGDDLEGSVDGSSMDSTSLDSQEEDESGPCLACRMEKRNCASFKAHKTSVLCATCGHPVDAHASRLKF
jgi:hypothetical protein